MQDHPPRRQVDAGSEAACSHDDLDDAGIERAGHDLSFLGRQSRILTTTKNKISHVGSERFVENALGVRLTMKCDTAGDGAFEGRVEANARISKVTEHLSSSIV